jgi:hypothetical protein
MARSVLKGGDEVLRNLNREIAKLRGRTRFGVYKAALLVRRESQRLTPVDQGNLISSAGTESVGSEEQPASVIYYTASYAPFVHEDLEARHTNGTAKFLEKALLENEGRVLRIIAKEAEIE